MTQSPSDPLSELSDITERLERLDGKARPLRKRAAALTVEALKAGEAPSTVAKHSPFSAAHVRTLARIAGLPPARRGKREMT